MLSGSDMRLSSEKTRWSDFQTRRKQIIVCVSSYIRAMRSLVQLALLCSAFCAASGLHFYLEAGTKRCFSESAPPNTKVLVEYTVSTGTGIMPVDLSVSMNKGAKVVVNRENVEHGKVAFVLPFSQADELRQIYRAEAHRRSSAQHQNAHGRDSSSDHDHERSDNRQKRGRRLLSVDDNARHPREQGGSTYHDREHGSDYHNFENDHERTRGRGMRDVGANEDAANYNDVHDDLDNFDMDNYDGIDDEALENDVIRNEREHTDKFGAFESLSDTGKEQEFFASRRFDLCVSNVVHKEEAKRRRVRLMVRKGDTAHDYTRLAKNEHMSQLEFSLKRISDELHQLMHELDQTQRMEDVLYRLNRGTNRQVTILCVLSLIVMVAVSGYQATYTKKYFKRKKVL